MRALREAESLPKGALKELLPLDDAVNAATAVARMRTELDTLKHLSHPGLIRLLDDRIDERWLVTEYFSDGTLLQHLGLFKGDALAALRAIRPIVDAVGALHAKGIVHRDIKPANVFVSGGRLVLGDCGLAFRMTHEDRLTDTFENVGSRDFMPAWAYSMRLDEVRPTFDVFSLGKLLWSMIAGVPHFPLWWFDQPRYDLRALFSGDEHMLFVHQLLAGSIVENEEQCQFADAGELCHAIDSTVRQLEGRAAFPSQSREMQCRFCGLGRYERFDQLQSDGFADPADKRRFFRCDACGHLASFFWRQDRPPQAWRD
jgi:serine/threonine protein kinase